jgi:glycosyltransferase involved in cell wall biosynthesis
MTDRVDIAGVRATDSGRAEQRAVVPESPEERVRIERVVPALDVGGVETLLKIQAREHDRARFELRVCAFWKAGRAAAEIRRAGIEVVELGIDPRIRNPRATALYLAHLRRTRPALVHASVPEADFHASVATRLAGIPCIIDEAGVPSRRPLARLVFSAIHRSSARIVAVSSQLADVLVRDEHAPRERITVIPTCAERESFESPKTRFERKGPLRIVTLGRLVPVKNLEVLVRAIAILARRGTEARLLVAGDGPERATLERVAAEERVTDRVSLLGFHEDRAGLLRDADVYAIPSWSEGCSLSLIEAMAAGVPVIASSVPGNLEVLGSELAAWTAPPDDAAAWADLVGRVAALDDDARRGLGATARAVATDRFSPTAYVRSVEATYAGVMRAGAGARVGRVAKGRRAWS